MTKQQYEFISIVGYHVTSKTYDIKHIAASMTEREKKVLLLVHAFSGCDTVSAVYGFGNIKFLKLLSVSNCAKIPEDIIKEFVNKNAQKATIQHKGIKLFQIMFSKNHLVKRKTGRRNNTKARLSPKR